MCVPKIGADTKNMAEKEPLEKRAQKAIIQESFLST